MSGGGACARDADLRSPTYRRDMTTPVVDPIREMFASASVTEHVVRGVLGLVLAVGSLVLASANPWALLGLVAAGVAWRGCPTCWTLGLAQTLSRRKAGCADGSCAGR